ncbi:hypothetical protein BU25DRAFT_4712 [Macroventuria anomochaeta]|uniref:Uncharacterized protein n=1 Tax=Macroventuria anomochaeta TaxID=301207 RepID=A0ACB6SGG8_9PLEO|nr:uncharacterized protein BU25DRAFT_4712 [Macroventuria anomochaeta]KAF2633380.1 hypothetical protein BU25DRAFT_4712 [Macroventuria anomochaeta]
MLSSLCGAVLSFIQHFFRSRLYQTLACAFRQPQSLYPGRWLFTKTTGPDARISHTSVQRFASYLGLRVALDRLRLQLAAATTIRHFISRLSRVLVFGIPPRVLPQQHRRSIRSFHPHYPNDFHCSLS